MPLGPAVVAQELEHRPAAPKSRTLELYERLGRFTDLIYCPLDLPTPPRIPREEFVDWVTRARAASKTCEEQRFDDDASGDAYPWNSAYAASHGEWLHGFDSRFPELVDYFGLFPAASWARVNVLVQEPREAVWPHTDPDPILGWRVYLGHGGARVFFHPMKERRSERPSTWTSEGRRDWSKYADTSRKIYASVPAEFCAWALNSYRATHAVEAHPGAAGERVAISVIPEVDRIDVDRYLALLERSVRKYADYAIWYPGT